MKKAALCAMTLGFLCSCQKSNDQKTTAIVMDKTGYSKVIHRPSGKPSYDLSPNGCPAGWAINRRRFLEPDGTYQIGCEDYGQKNGVEVDFDLPGEKNGIHPQDRVN